MAGCAASLRTRVEIRSTSKARRIGAGSSSRFGSSHAPRLSIPPHISPQRVRDLGASLRLCFGDDMSQANCASKLWRLATEKKLGAFSVMWSSVGSMPGGPARLDTHHRAVWPTWLVSSPPVSRITRLELNRPHSLPIEHTVMCGRRRFNYGITVTGAPGDWRGAGGASPLR